MSLISGSMIPLGSLVFGPIADIIEAEWLLIGAGLLMVVQSLLMLKSKALIVLEIFVLNIIKELGR